MIEDNVPIPKRNGPRTQAGREARDLKVGQSAFYETKSQMETARWTIWNLGGKYETRKRDENGRRGWRIWRIA